MIRLKRVYEKPSSDDGLRILVDRLWPRGLSKKSARIDVWLKEVAPSNGLRKWYGHDPDRWSDFQKRYRAEVLLNPVIKELRRLIRSNRRVMLLFAAKDVERNNAVVLRKIIG